MSKSNISSSSIDYRQRSKSVRPERVVSANETLVKDMIGRVRNFFDNQDSNPDIENLKKSIIKFVDDLMKESDPLSSEELGRVGY
jgi:hypothetical protein